jgi:hypothetical protein
MIQITSTNGIAPGASSTDADLDQLYSWMPPMTPPPEPCPEALFSLTLRGAIDGNETLLTVRGMTPAEFQQNLASVRGLLDPKPQPQTPASAASPQQHNAAAQHRPITGVCPIHQVAMKENVKDGRSWWSHRTVEGQWCKGR